MARIQIHEVISMYWPQFCIHITIEPADANKTYQYNTNIVSLQSIFKFAKCNGIKNPVVTKSVVVVIFGIILPFVIGRNKIFLKIN